MVELIDAALPDFASKTELVPSGAVRNNVGEVAGNVIAAFRRRKSNLLKS